MIAALHKNFVRCFTTGASYFKNPWNADLFFRMRALILFAMMTRPSFSI
jgi:hypothetical protein